MTSHQELRNTRQTVSSSNGLDLLPCVVTWRHETSFRVWLRGDTRHRSVCGYVETRYIVPCVVTWRHETSFRVWLRGDTTGRRRCVRLGSRRIFMLTLILLLLTTVCLTTVCLTTVCLTTVCSLICWLVAVGRFLLVSILGFVQDVNFGLQFGCAESLSVCW